ncbi:MAG: redoxin domain-containing protein [Chloroflexi bacterium]|nr:redoxin domain-containing protein [Chloroflexota bacterium]
MRHLRWLLVPILVVPLGWLLFTGFGRDPREVASPLIGQPAPEWTLSTLDGDLLSTDDLAGRPYVVNFWASWCIPACVDEHPVLAAVHDRHGDAMTMVGVLYQDTTADAEAFLARYGDAGYPHLVDPDGRLAIDFGVTGPPETFFVDADGIIRDKQFGPLTDALMDERLASIGFDR